MGDHFLPQLYLRGFAQPGESRLWMYEKGERDPGFLPITGIAKENRLYGELEPYLAKEIEGPANRVLRKIRNEKVISASDKEALSGYIYNLRKRVPSGFERFRGYAPSISVKVMDELKSKWNPNRPGYTAKIEKAKVILAELEKNPTRELWRQALLVSNEASTMLLSRMTWMFAACKEPEIFITSDNPVFFHGELGINKQNSEVSFPISNHICLLATWWRIRDLSYVVAKPVLIKEINRRTASNAARFAYAGTRHDWIATLLNKKDHEIHYITPPK